MYKQIAYISDFNTLNLEYITVKAEPVREEFISKQGNILSLHENILFVNGIKIGKFNRVWFNACDIQEIDLFKSNSKRSFLYVDEVDSKYKLSPSGRNITFDSEIFNEFCSCLYGVFIILHYRKSDLDNPVVQELMELIKRYIKNSRRTLKLIEDNQIVYKYSSYLDERKFLNEYFGRA